MFLIINEEFAYDEWGCQNGTSVREEGVDPGVNPSVTIWVTVNKLLPSLDLDFLSCKMGITLVW